MTRARAKLIRRFRALLAALKIADEHASEAAIVKAMIAFDAYLDAKRESDATAER